MKTKRVCSIYAVIDGKRRALGIVERGRYVLHLVNYAGQSQSLRNGGTVRDELDAVRRLRSNWGLARDYPVLVLDY